MLVLSGMASYPVKDFMTKTILTIDAERSTFEASQEMEKNDEGYLIVLAKAQPLGIITNEDIVRKVVAKQRNSSETKVAEIVSTPLITIDPDIDVRNAVGIMVKNSIRRLPVARDGIIYGIFTALDLAKHFAEYEDKVVRDIIKSMSLISF